MDEPTEKPAPHPINVRVKAARLRSRARTGLPLAPEEAAELHAYEQSVGASKSASRKVSYTEEEDSAQAYGTGGAAEMAAAGAMVREEGRRLDSILTVGISALQRSNDVYFQMVQALLKRTENFEMSQIKMMTAMREHYLGRIEAEGELMKVENAKEDEQDPLTKMATDMLPMLLPQIMAAMSSGKSGGGDKKP
jgi:hypothetical protein